MLKSEVRNALFHAVAVKVKPLGFQSNKKDYSFIREFDGGFHQITFPIVDYSPKIIASILVGTRLDVLDDLANRFDTTIAPEARSRQVAVQVQPDYFPDRPKKYAISTEQELTNNLAAIVDVLEKDLLPFMERCTNIGFVARVLESESGSWLQPNPLARSLAIVAAASLAGSKDIAAIAAKARARLEMRNISLELQIFDQTLEYILKGSTE